jgi:hypothetical protein
MKIVIHVGPHRTATTSIQSFLASSRSELSEAGIWYPTCRIACDAHHVLAWKVLGRELSTLGIHDDSRDAGRVLRDWKDEAQDFGCHTLLLSSEDFAVLRDFGWRSLRSSVEEIAAWKIVAVRRSPALIAESAYSHMLLNGLAQEWGEVADVLARGSQDFYDYLGTLAISRSWCKVEEIEYCDDADWFIHKVVSALVGRKIAKRLNSSNEVPHLNTRLDKSMWAPLLEFNRLNTPDFVLDPKTGSFPESYYAQLPNELPKIAWVAALLRDGLTSERRQSLAS